MIDPATGRCVWQGAAEFNPGRRRWNPRAAVRGAAIFVAHEQRVDCFDAATGAWWWQVPTGAAITERGDRWRRDSATDGLIIDILRTEHGDRAVCRTEDGQIDVVDMFSGRSIWSDVPGPGGHEVVDGVGVLVRSTDGVARLRDANGDTMWQRSLEGMLVCGATVFATSGGVHGKTRLSCIDASTGRQRWGVPAGQLRDGPAGVADADRAVLLVPATAGARVWMVDPIVAPRSPGFVARVLGRAPGTPLPVPNATVSCAARTGSRVFLVVDSPSGVHLIVLRASTGRAVATAHHLSDTDKASVRTRRGRAVLRCARLDGSVVLRAFDGDGRLQWEREANDVTQHFCLGDDVIVRHAQRLTVLNANDGATRYDYDSQFVDGVAPLPFGAR